MVNRHALLEKNATYYNANGITLTDEQKTRETRGQTATFDLDPHLYIERGRTAAQRLENSDA